MSTVGYSFLAHPHEVSQKDNNSANHQGVKTANVRGTAEFIPNSSDIKFTLRIEGKPGTISYDASPKTSEGLSDSGNTGGYQGNGKYERPISSI
jgi:hypothetical protein